MKQVFSCSGQELLDMMAVGSSWLEKSAPDINAINVFPVPDGDTGTNMLLTMRSVMEEADRASDDSVSAVAKAMAYGALMGARGNSGVILSQIFRGLAKGLEGKESFDGKDWAEALVQASHAAYQGLSQPVEGTILTVIRDVSTSAEAAAQANPADLTCVAEAAVEAAKNSVARTPLLLPVLREAGVVDAGGQGLYVLLEGALHYLRGETEEMQYRKPQMVTADLPLSSKAAQLVAEPEEPYGYCTNFLVEGQKLNPDKIRHRLEGKGQSLIVTGDDTNVRVHIHTYDPGAILKYVISLGTLHQIQIQNMDDQHVGFVEMQQERLPTADIAVVAVASGSGLREVFQSLGVAAVVPGGQTMNPSVREVLQTVESVPSQKVILLPNNKNIILTASQVQPLTDKEVVVVPTKTIPQGIAALLSFSYEGALEEAAQAMEEAIATVKTVEVTKAVRSTQIKGLKVRKGQAIGIVDDEDLVAAGDSITDVLFEALDKVGIESVEVVTLYYGADVEAAQAEEIIQEIGNKYPEKQVELIRGGQPHYNYIVSLE
ncbi:MAG TPA: DAK2 domain-containing protein [Dehalococcoidia bacterium]|nr:DAK2 domain-containing protein [Dehalococcoidia bacterium]